ncbi:hypothetical protein ACFQH6_12080 [Halobacteriaceae archaeon GCM10025711]
MTPPNSPLITNCIHRTNAFEVRALRPTSDVGDLVVLVANVSFLATLFTEDLRFVAFAILLLVLGTIAGTLSRWIDTLIAGFVYLFIVYGYIFVVIRLFEIHVSPKPLILFGYGFTLFVLSIPGLRDRWSSYSAKQ